MGCTDDNPSRIHILREDVAKKIAAGEVIDRPFSVVRELLDNSIDARSSDISVTIVDGGMSLIRVADNGDGMNRADLELCSLPHATSKITSSQDIYIVNTLGFRGEALASIATVSRTEITSATQEPLGNRLLVEGGKIISLEEERSRKGTTVEVSSLFYNLPARKKFLKSASSESGLCGAVFLDKALPFPDIAFRYFVKDKLKTFLPASSLEDRVKTVYRDAFPGGESLTNGLCAIEGSGNGYSARIIGFRPEMTRKDRLYLRLFVNNRRVSDYGLLHAVEYGYADMIPGKDFPIAAVFLKIDPALVDFNIHPAKKECRIRIQQELHRALVTLVKQMLGGFVISTHGMAKPHETRHGQEDIPITAGESAPAYHRSEKDLFDPVEMKRTMGELKKAADFSEMRGPEEKQGGIRYHGQIFGLFLLASREDNFYIIDQHAAHERILYEELRSKSAASQELMFPIVFDVSDDEAEFIAANLQLLGKTGITIEKAGPLSFEITSLPVHLDSTDPEEIIRLLTEAGGSIEELEKKLAAVAACRHAVKDGDKVDSLTARAIIEGAFSLPDARCPHGRPIWHRISRTDLFRLLGRL